jgi:hypothetical protein
MLWPSGALCSPVVPIFLAACLGALSFASDADSQQPASARRIGVLLVRVSPESKEALEFRRRLLGRVNTILFLWHTS